MGRKDQHFNRDPVTTTTCNYNTNFQDSFFSTIIIFRQHEERKRKRETKLPKQKGVVLVGK